MNINRNIKKTAVLLAAIALLLCGCAKETGTSDAKSWHDIPFEEGQLYALAYLGYQTPEKLDDYCAKYLNNAALPTHYLSGGDYYLVIPRDDACTIRLYQNNMETAGSVLFYGQPNGQPFVVQCNVSDIFPDLTVEIVSGEESVRFSPFISLENGEVQPVERGLLLGE